MLANTPWTFPFWLAWALLSFVAPLFVVAIIVLSSLRATRSVGLRMLLFGILGAIVGCAGAIAVAILAGEPLSQSTAMGWAFAAGGGFSLFAIFAGLIAWTSLRARGLTNR